MSFEEQLNEYIPFIRNFAKKFFKKPEDQEDLTQDVLLTAWKFQDKFKAGTNLKAWLGTITKRLAYNKTKTDKRFPLQLEIDDKSLTMLYTVRTEYDEEVVCAIDSISPLYKDPLMLQLEGFSYAEISKMMDLKIGTVMSRIYRAKKFLKKELGEYYART